MNDTVRLLVARVGKAHGIRGEVTVQVYTDTPEARFASGASLFTDNDPMVVVSSRDHNGVLLVAFEGVDDRSGAEALRGLKLYAEVNPSAESEDDAWFEHELVGLVVHDQHGAVRGRVVGIEHLPAQDLLVIDVGERQPRLVPLVADLVPEVDVAGGHLVVADRPGLLGDEPGPGAGTDDGDGSGGR